MDYLKNLNAENMHVNLNAVIFNFETIILIAFWHSTKRIVLRDSVYVIGKTGVTEETEILNVLVCVPNLDSEDFESFSDFICTDTTKGTDVKISVLRHENPEGVLVRLEGKNLFRPKID